VYISEIWVGFVLGIIAAFVLFLLLATLASWNDKRPKF